MLKYSLVLSGLFLTACAQAQTQSQTLESIIDEDWAVGSYWNDGKAEVATYDGNRVMYGKSSPHEQKLITVTEDFNKDYMVKADWPYGDKPLLPVLKQNQVATIETPNYPYHFMTSVFHQRDDLNSCVKMTVTSHEWCGITTKEFMTFEKPTLTYMSYWDGQGTGSRDLAGYDQTNTYFQEELPLLVRAIDHQDGLTATFDLYPNQTMSRANPSVMPSPASLKVHQATDIPASLDTDLKPADLWEIRISAPGGEMTFLVEKEYPNTLVHYDFGDGRSYDLKESIRWAYWERTD